MLPSNGLKGHLGSTRVLAGVRGGRTPRLLPVGARWQPQGLGIDHLDVWQFVHTLGHPAGQMISLAGLVANGVFDRYPGLRMAFLEGGVSWFLTCLERFDSSWASFRQLDPDGRFPRIPAGKKVSEYLVAHIDAGRIFIGCEGDELGLGPAVGLIGFDAVLLLLRLPARGHGADVSRRSTSCSSSPT